MLPYVANFRNILSAVNKTCRSKQICDYFRFIVKKKIKFYNGFSASVRLGCFDRPDDMTFVRSSFCYIMNGLLSWRKLLIMSNLLLSMQSYVVSHLSLHDFVLIHYDLTENYKTNTTIKVKLFHLLQRVSIAMQSAVLAMIDSV